MLVLQFDELFFIQESSDAFCMFPALIHSQFIICAAEAYIATLSSIFAYFITALPYLILKYKSLYETNVARWLLSHC